ncbi:phage protein [Methylorubrum populi]|uniref:Phage protein n=1 Tax=Methylorubrum populi TaxID=223967 RepID=A0A833JAX7_9HYPH|nr:hypothetical protein [Methylorubrum populi]KAB7788049.1 Phage protein [Methylorubrum populi]
MGEQYARNWKVAVGGGGKELDTAGLRIRFATQQQDSSTPHVLNLFITNPSRATIEVIREEYKKITLSAGYNSDIGALFSGEIIQVRSGRENVIDTYCHIMATASERPRNFGVVNKALAAGHTYRDRIDVAAKAFAEFGITVGHIDDLGNKKFPRNFICFGMAKDLLREVCEATGASWHIHNGKLNVLKNKNTLPDGAVVLNSDTGMVGLPEQTIQGVIVRCLLNYRIRPGTKLQINESSIQRAAFNPSVQGAGSNELLKDNNILGVAADGFYKALLVEHNGDTRGPNWYTEIVCVKADGGSSLALYNRGIRTEERD